MGKVVWNEFKTIDASIIKNATSTSYSFKKTIILKDKENKYTFLKTNFFERIFEIICSFFNASYYEKFVGKNKSYTVLTPQEIKSLNRSCNWQNLTQSNHERVNETKELEQRYAKLRGLTRTYFGYIAQIPGEFSLHMPGVALAASHLAKKHSLKNLYVANSLEAFILDAKKRLQSNENQRLAYVVGLTQTGHQHPNFPQHKAAIVIEKKNGQISIAVLDAMPTLKDIQNHKDLDKGLWDGNYQPSHLTLRAIKELNLPNAKVYYSPITRENVYGCETYALEDAAAFLKDPQFFEKIRSSPATYVKTSDPSRMNPPIKPLILPTGNQIYKIDELPAAFLIGAQTSKAWKSFTEKYKDDDQKLHVVGTKKKITDYIKKYGIQTKLGIQNHFITRKMFKNYDLVLNDLETKSPQEIEKILSEVLVSKEKGTEC